MTEVTKRRTAFLQAQAREKTLRDELAGLEYDLPESRAAEEAAAVAVLDGGSDKLVAKATAKVRDIADAIRIKQLQLTKLAERTQAASAALADALADQRLREQEAEYQQLQTDMSAICGKLSELDEALRAAKSRAAGIVERYRAAGGRRANLQTFQERLRQLICNQLSEVSLLERGGNPDCAASLAAYVSEIAFLSRRAA